MTREQILERLLLQVGDGLWMMAALKIAGKPVNKERLRDLTNNHFKNKAEDSEQALICSRHMLDQMTARLEGAGLVETFDLGRAKMYTLSELGNEIIKFREQWKRGRGE